MTIVQILIGLLGLGIVVFVHELGHLLAAKAVGIEVEAFSLGWGPRLVGFTWRDTEYRISVFPIGGYCKMKGERSYVDALENAKDTIDPEPGSFFGAKPWKRIVTLLAGPFANVLFACVAMSLIYWAGFTQEDFGNRIVLASDFVETIEASAADAAGLQTGDTVVRIGNRSVESWADLQYEVGRNALRSIEIEILRDGRRLVVNATPAIDGERPRGILGVFAWVDPVVQGANGSAALIGLQAGDRIALAGGEPIAHFWELSAALSAGAGDIDLGIIRDGQPLSLSIPADARSGISNEIIFERLLLPSPDYHLIQAIGRGTGVSMRYLTDSVDALRLLFQGVRFRNAVAGPVQITSTIGQIAIDGFRIDFSTGAQRVFDFLSFLSMVLFFMNLLPIPVLDGGQIVLAGVEWIRGRGARPKTIYRYQIVGSLMVFAILFFALFSDVLFVIGR